MKDWTEYGVRTGGPVMSAVEPATFPPAMQPAVNEIRAAARQVLAEPIRGITSDGVIVPRTVRRHRRAARSTAAPIREAAAAVRSSRSPGHERATPLSSRSAAEQRRTWFEPPRRTCLRHGRPAGRTSAAARRAAGARTWCGRPLSGARVRVRRATSCGSTACSRISRPARPISANGVYFISIFGTPSEDEPWGWQLDGHHLNVNCLVLGEDMVVTPTFMGSEPCRVGTGPLAGVEVLAARIDAGALT